MATDRITEIRIQGMRSLADVRLKLGGLTVLIGENGSGKSSILEAFEILRKTTEPEFFARLSRVHGGLPNLLRTGAPGLSLHVAAQVADVPIAYSLTLAIERSVAVVKEEELRADVPEAGWQTEIRRLRDNFLFYTNYRAGEFGTASVRNVIEAPLDGLMLGPRRGFALSSDDEKGLKRFGQRHPQPILDGFTRLLSSIHVQLPFAIRPYWTGRELGDRFSLRDAATVAPATSLARSAENFVSCYQRLRNESSEHWEETMELVRLGLGDDVESVNTPAAGPGGALTLTLALRGSPQPIFAEAMSDGQLAYLALVALARLPGEPSLIAIDEPEAHMHPHLLVRVLEILEHLAERCPVLLATHSDRLLDELADAAASAVLCELDEQRATRLRKPDASVLARWMERYRGLGDLRAAGYESSVMQPTSE